MVNAYNKKMANEIVMGIHGLGGHSGWFSDLAKELKTYDIDFVAYDLPGFGQNHNLSHQQHSPYTKGHIDSFMDWVNFTQKKYQDLKTKNPNSRITILGHSLGAVIAVNLYDFSPEDRLILSVPGFKGAGKTFSLWFTINTMRKILIDKFIFGNDVFIEMPVSEKSQETPAFKDPLRVSNVTQTLLYQILQLHKQTRKHLARLTMPILMLQISEDQVVDNTTQNKYFNLLGSTNKTVKRYDSGDHDWIWYPICKDIAHDIATWLQNT